MSLPNLKRVIIEIDGKHHYAQGDRADTRRYAAMVRVDCDLHLREYEVYRFGGAEFRNNQNNVEENALFLIKEFFYCII